jgi:hypothetical protein
VAIFPDNFKKSPLLVGSGLSSIVFEIYSPLDSSEPFSSDFFSPAGLAAFAPAFLPPLLRVDLALVAPAPF